MKIAIAGFGALGAATEKAALKSKNTDLFGIFTRRPPDSIRKITNSPVYAFDEIEKYKDEIDVVINCMGSAFDLPKTTPCLAGIFNQVDSFDTHKKIREHYKNTAEQAKKGGKLSLICAGWDPGLFSIARAYMQAVLPYGKTYTFWGEGVSRGHSNAIKQIHGVVDAVQYTSPIGSAIFRVRNGEFPELKTNEMHKRICYVVAEAGANTQRIESDIKNMPDYFADYETEVHFLDYESFLSEHKTMKHGGSVIRCQNDNGELSTIDFSLKLASNPYFTAMTLISFASAVKKMNEAGECGCITPLDIRPSDLLDGEAIFDII